MSTHSVLGVARQILQICNSKNRKLTPMQLIKLTYIAHGWTLALLDRQLFRERVEAWRYGPVLPELYQQIKRYRDMAVGEVPGAPEITLAPEEADIVNQVCDLYGGLTGIQLSQLTHQSGTPWHLTWRDDEPSRVIPNEVIQQHYKALAKQQRQEEEVPA